jgi:hypothetical protein
VWKKKGGIWFQAEESPLKDAVSPRPHIVTIILGLVSPIVSVAALLISIQSLNTAQDSFYSNQINQRAYLGVLAVTAVPQRDKFTNNPKIEIRVKNFGNTPAYISDATLKFYAVDAAKFPVINVEGFHKFRNVRVINTAVEIGQKDEAIVWVVWGAGLELPKLSTDVIVIADLPYKDVFNDVHKVQWGWRMVNQKVTSAIDIPGMSIAIDLLRADDKLMELQEELDKATRNH